MMARTEEERNILRQGGKRLAKVLEALVGKVTPGRSTLELDELAESLIRDCGGEPAFKGYRPYSNEPPFPASICTSINDEVVHGIPSRRRRLGQGDVLGIDIGMRYPAKGGLVTDTALTVAVGPIAPDAERLLRETQKALARGIAVLRPGIRLGDLGQAIQQHLESNGLGVVRELVGHGVGHVLHEEPNVPNFGEAGEGRQLAAGTVIAIEPMATLGSPEVVLAKDGWTWRTRDGSLAAHFEHTVLITKGGSEILTAP